LINIHDSELVTGDIVKISEGMDLNADMFVLEAYDIVIDESALTGESRPIKKKTYKQCIDKKNQAMMEGKENWRKDASIPSPILMSGTKVTERFYTVHSLIS